MRKLEGEGEKPHEGMQKDDGCQRQKKYRFEAKKKGRNTGCWVVVARKRGRAA